MIRIKVYSVQNGTIFELTPSQIELLLAEVCPQAEDPDMCVEQLPAFWSALAPIMWSASFDSSVWCGDCFKV